MELITNLARLIVAADRHLTTEEQEMLQPELSDLVRAFNASEMGRFMPLSTYAFDGDRARAVERWLVESLRPDAADLIARTAESLAGLFDEG